ncbi:hypothetical protein KRX54_01055 [Actinomycetaceae bacterium TAE3-ERU4]|nr:hypothetical protein [Actinomycetaceae bacterium TAE3-ERU4]
MGNNLKTISNDKWDILYDARGDDVQETRLFLTGDVFTDIELPGSTGTTKKRTVMLVQHPCSMRKGIELNWRLLAVEVTKRKPPTEEEWGGYFNLMFLPDLFPESTSRKIHQAANFDNFYVLSPDLLKNRIACLSREGIEILMQRWVNYSSRVIVPIGDFGKQLAPVIEETDLFDEWCEARDINNLEQGKSAHKDYHNWLRSPLYGEKTPQEMLKDESTRSTVRKEMRKYLKSQ